MNHKFMMKMIAEAYEQGHDDAMDIHLFAKEPVEFPRYSEKLISWYELKEEKDEAKE